MSGFGTDVTTLPASGERIARRVRLALCISGFLAAFNFSAPAPFFPEIARDLNTTVPLVGQVVTLMMLISGILGLVVGPLADRYGYRWPLGLGLLAIAVNLFGMSFAPSYPVLLTFGVIGGLGDALVFALPLAIAGTLFAGDARRRMIGWIIGSFSAATIVGIPLLALLGSATGWRMALALAGVAGAGAAWFVVTALPPDHRPATSQFRVSELIAAYAPLLRDAATLRLLGVTAMRALSWIGFLAYLGAFLVEAVGLTMQAVGFAYLLEGVGFLIGSVVAGGRLGGLSPRLLVIAASAATGVALGPMLFAPNVWVVAPLLAVGSAATAMVGVGVATLLAAESPAGAGTTMVLNGTILNLGTAASAALNGGLIALGGYPALGIVLPVFAFAAAILAAWPAAQPCVIPD